MIKLSNEIDTSSFQSGEKKFSLWDMQKINLLQLMSNIIRGKFSYQIPHLHKRI